MTLQEKISEIGKEFRKKRARCSVWCGCWSKADGGCGLYGENHLTPSACWKFLKAELNRRESGAEGGCGEKAE